MKLSEQTKKSLAKVVEKSAATIGEAIDASGKIVKDNAKELVTEVIVYEGYVNNAFGILASLIGAKLLEVATTYVMENHSDYWGLYILFGFVGFGMLVWFLCSIQEIIKARLAPRLFLISYAVSLMKGDEEKGKK